ncbi:MAG: hypothetical protein FJ211_04525 [Ignavibacteria bacterium]|nr:hypothetical protein [Ignavibacteria bacterium]
MRVFIAVDMEGITGVVHPDQLLPDGRGYQQAQQLLVGDVNAVVDGILDVHPDAEIIIGDGHATMRNIDLQQLRPSVELIVGPGTIVNKPLCQLEGIQYGADVAFCVGYHSKAGTVGGLLSHTFVGSLIADLRLNGKSIGEVEANAAVLSAKNIPLALVSGSSDLVTEIRAWSPSLTVVSTKTTLGPTAAICKTPAVTASMLRSAASAAVRNTQSWHLRDVGAATFEVTTKQNDQLERAISLPRVERVSDDAFAVYGDDAEIAFRGLWSACIAALGEVPQWLR